MIVPFFQVSAIKSAILQTGQAHSCLIYDHQENIYIIYIYMYYNVFFVCDFYVSFPRTVPGTDHGSAILQSRVVSRTKYKKLISKIFLEEKYKNIARYNRGYPFCTVSTTLQYSLILF